MKGEKHSSKHTVLILGGGLAGMAAGYELVRAGKRVVVFEKADQIGGLARTIEKDGFRFDTGPHRWYTKNNMVNQWMLDLMGDEVIHVPRLTRIYFDGKFFYYPIKLMNVLSGIGFVQAVIAVCDYALSRTKARLFSQKLRNMEDGYINQFGRTLYKIFFQRYSEKLWGQDCRNISIDWVGQRTRGLNILTILKDTFFKSNTVVSLVDEFSYPRDGVGRIAEKLAEGIRQGGGRIHTRSDVLQIQTSSRRVTSVVVNENGKEIRYFGSHVISSIPLDEVCQRLTPSVLPQLLHLSKKLTYRDELQVALFVKKSHITPDTWIYIHPKELPFMRIMEMDNWSDTLAPKGCTTLVFEIACNATDPLWMQSDKDIVALVSRSYIDEFASISQKDIIGSFVHRAPKEYPVYHLGYKEDVDAIKKLLKRFSNLQLIGRNGTFRYNNMDHSIEMGLYAAWNIISGKHTHNIESVNIEREYLEEKKIEIIEDENVESSDKESSS